MGLSNCLSATSAAEEIFTPGIGFNESLGKLDAFACEWVSLESCEYEEGLTILLDASKENHNQLLFEWFQSRLEELLPFVEKNKKEDSFKDEEARRKIFVLACVADLINDSRIKFSQNQKEKLSKHLLYPPKISV